MTSRTLPIALLALVPAALAQPARAGLEQAASATSAAFSQAQRGAAVHLVPALGRFLRSSDQAQELMALLDDERPAVRARAAKSLSVYAGTNSRVERKLLEVLDRGWEVKEVKRETIKSLSWAAQNGSSRNALLRIATDDGQDEDLRQISFKSLYVAVQQSYEVRNALVRALGDSRETLAVRKAAAWALWSNVRDHDSRRALSAVATESREEPGLRAEAVKSLFSAMNEYGVKSEIERMATNRSLEDDLREPAILCLLLVNNDWGIQRLLKDIASNDPSPRASAAAATALGGLTLELARYFHLSWYRGHFIDPLENQ